MEILSGHKTYIPKFKFWSNVAVILLRTTTNPKKIYKVVKHLMGVKKKFMGKNGNNKVVVHEGRVFLDLTVPGWGRESFRQNINFEVNQIINPANNYELRLIMLAITKKCPLNCEHCYAWEELNQPETLSLDHLKQIVHRFNSRGASYFILGGGEPMVRFKDLIKLLEDAPKNSDYWMSTSGFNLTAENALKLKKAGLTGALVSLDHFDPDHHNKFRGRETSFQEVEAALENCHKAGLLTALSICLTNEFMSRENLEKYFEFARSKKVAFVQFLEPKSVGKYANKNVHLTPENVEIAEQFFFEYNFDEAYHDMPIISYHAFYQRKVGCPGAGTRSLLINTDGYFKTCPFCTGKGSYALTEDLDQAIQNLRGVGCDDYKLYQKVG